MDLHINKREELSKKIELYSRRLDEAINRDDTELAMDIEDQLETMTTNMNYIQSNVSECQTCIMQMEEEARVCHQRSLESFNHYKLGMFQYFGFSIQVAILIKKIYYGTFFIPFNHERLC